MLKIHTFFRENHKSSSFCEAITAKLYKKIIKDDRRGIFIEIKDGSLVFNGEDIDAGGIGLDTDRPLDVHYILDTDQTHRLLVQLRLKHNTRNKLSTILKNEFGSFEGAQAFVDYCDEIGVTVQVLRF